MKMVTDDTFQELVRENIEPQIVYFTGAWCQPCKTFGPVVQAASEKFTDIEFLKADMDECEAIAHSLNIRTLPSLVLFDGGMVRHLQTGTMTAEQLRLWIQENI